MVCGWRLCAWFGCRCAIGDGRGQSRRPPWCAGNEFRVLKQALKNSLPQLVEVRYSSTYIEEKKRDVSGPGLNSYKELMSSVPPGSSPLRLPRGEVVCFPTGRPNIPTLVSQIAALGYSVAFIRYNKPTSVHFLRGFGIGLWSSGSLFYLLFLPLSRLSRHRTRATTALPTSHTTTRIM